MGCPSIFQFWLDFLLRSKTYLKERPLSANREFPLSNKPEDVVRLVYTQYKVQITQLHSWYTRYLAQDASTIQGQIQGEG